MAKTLEALIQDLQSYDGPPIQLMEVCGTHTQSISKYGIPALLPANISLLSGPGCPVCVTPAGYIDQAVELSLWPNSTVLSFGDMWRVPGQKMSLLQAKAEGGSVGLMYSPMDALKEAAAHPDRMFYVAAVGFETTLPLYGLLMEKAKAQHIENIRLLCCLKALMPALEWICQNNPAIDGFIGPGHVSAILGYAGYETVCKEYRIPLTVAGFRYEPLIAALYDLVQQRKKGTCEVHNMYPSAVTKEGNREAQALIARCFTPKSSLWRGLGSIPASGYMPSPEFEMFNEPLNDSLWDSAEPKGCLCGSVIMGRAKPVQCGSFGTVCTPENPLGPCMVSTEGTCGIWHANSRTR